jgi:hypothetical protein
MLFGRQGVMHQGWIDKVNCKRYALVAARSCAQGVSFRVTTDSSKVVKGKSWLMTGLLNITTGEAMWCAPQVPLKHKPYLPNLDRGFCGPLRGLVKSRGS